ncbi:MAG: hypothetical protein ACTSPE_07930 [Candidatus Thorarchaeota archaeon]
MVERGIVAVAISYIPVMLLYDIPNYLAVDLTVGINVETAADLMRIAMLIVIAVTLMTDMEYFYRIPIDVYAITVNATSGVNLYTYGTEKVNVDTNLLASALTAIFTVVKESSGNESGLRRIVTDDRIIIIENRPEHELNITVLAERSSLVLVRSTQMFADLVVGELNGRSALDLIEALDVEKMEGLVRQAFPFLKTRG